MEALRTIKAFSKMFVSYATYN